VKATIYHRPHGRPEVIDLVNVDPADAAWFEANNVKISLEADGEEGAITYADIGLKDEDGEPDELIEFSHGRNCVQTLAALRRQCEEHKAKEPT
jgi:hypothetical protein